MVKQNNKERISELMVKLKCSEKEAIDIIECDDVIDHDGTTYFDLPPDEEKEAKKLANVKTRKKKDPDYKFEPRKKKPDILKEKIVEILYQFLLDDKQLQAEDVVITNKNRMINFSVEGTKFDLTLIKKT